MISQKYIVPDAEVEIIPFAAIDGFWCNLVHVTSDKATEKGPVLLIHGAGVSANIFLAPVKHIVSFLLEAGYDVWLENWRASIDFAPNEWTLDQAAFYDHPAAVNKVLELTGADSLKAIIHCQGSTSFMIAAVLGLVPAVTNIISNAVSLHPLVPAFSRLKLAYIMPLVKGLTNYLNPQWGMQAPTLTAKLLNALVWLTHHECDNAVCKQVSFTYGTGFPALWLHENLNEETHEWLKQEFAHVPLTFYQQINQSVKAGHLVSAPEENKKQISYVARLPATEARISFYAGAQNLCFLPDSQRKSFRYFDNIRPNFHRLRIIAQYSHLDIFMGKEAYRNVFPLMLQDLNN